MNKGEFHHATSITSPYVLRIVTFLIMLFSLGILVQFYIAADIVAAEIDKKKKDENTARSEYVNYCEDKDLAALYMDHIGVSDKPIASILLLTSKEAFLPFMTNRRMDKEAYITKKELKCICEIFARDKLIEKKYNQSFEFGSFSFAFLSANDAHWIIFNRKDSVSVFQKISKCLDNNGTAKQMVELNVLRIEPRSN